MSDSVLKFDSVLTLSRRHEWHRGAREMHIVCHLKLAEGTFAPVRSDSILIRIPKNCLFKNVRERMEMMFESEL